jgi:hypothetical protein
MIGKYIEQLEDAGDLIFYPAEVIKQVNKIPLGTLKKIMRSFSCQHKSIHKGNYVEHNGGSSSGTFAITGVYIVHYHPDNEKNILKLLFERIKNKKKKSFKTI